MTRQTQHIPESAKSRSPEAKLFYKPEKIYCSCGWFVDISANEQTKILIVECMNMQCSQYEVRKKVPMPEIFWEQA